VRRHLLSIATLLLASCSDPTGLGRTGLRVLERRLEQAEARWAANGPASYVMTIQRYCYCSTVVPREVTVVDGVVTDVREVGAATPLPENEWSWYPSVSALFTTAHEAIDAPAADLSFDFHDTLGYPVEIAIDWDHRVVDEEVTFRVLSFTPSF
jgi:hypothetical protein